MPTIESLLSQARWITAPEGAACPLFRRAFRADRPVARATLRITARGVYEAVLNGTRVGAFLLAALPFAICRSLSDAAAHTTPQRSHSK